MRYILILSLFVLMSDSVSAQKLEIFGGINSNHLYDNIGEDTPTYTSTFKSGKGYTIGFSYDNPNMSGYANRITLSYNTIKGNLSTAHTPFDDGGTYTNAEIQKSSFNFAVYPFTFIVQNVYFGFGLQGNLLLSNSTSGKTGVITIAGNDEIDLSDSTEPAFHKDFGYGVTMRAHYNIMLSNGLSIVPRYNLYYGIGEEFSTQESEKVKVWQQVLAIGIAMQL